jgi:hypothetical protein
MARGDHIKVRRYGGLYTHHGIDMGDGTVIHLSGEPLRRREAHVCRTSLESFLGGGKAVVVQHRNPGRTLEEAAAAAESLLSRRDYCLWRNNCEHVATWCRTGRHQSRQVVRALRVAGGAAGASLALLVPLLVSRRRTD